MNEALWICGGIVAAFVICRVVMAVGSVIVEGIFRGK